MQESYLKYYIIGGILAVLLVLFGKDPGDGMQKPVSQERDPALRDLNAFYEQKKGYTAEGLLSGERPGGAGSPTYRLPGGGGGAPGYQGQTPDGAQRPAPAVQQPALPPNWSVSPYTPPATQQRPSYAPDSKLESGETIVFSGTKVLKEDARGRLRPLRDGVYKRSDGRTITIKNGNQRISGG